jgi:pimeloyl-ACP methyl ester carboxylesterase
MLTLRLAFLIIGFQGLHGCVHVRLDAASLLTPDQRPEAALLGPGYRVERGIIVDADQIVAITRAHRSGNQVVILFCGGDSFRRSRDGGLVLQALALDADVVLFDYPGFGDSTGTPTPENLVRAGRAVHRFIVGLPGATRQRLVVYGFSLGGLVAAQLARQVPADAVVLEATAPDVTSWVRTQIPWYAVPFVRVHLDEALANVDGARSLRSFAGRVLLLAGGNDRRAPVSLSRDYYTQLQGAGVKASLVIVPGAAHGAIHRSDEFRYAYRQFLAAL